MMAINFIAHYGHVINYSAEFNHPFITPASLLRYIRKKKAPLTRRKHNLFLDATYRWARSDARFKERECPARLAPVSQDGVNLANLFHISAFHRR